MIQEQSTKRIQIHFQKQKRAHKNMQQMRLRLMRKMAFLGGLCLSIQCANAFEARFESFKVKKGKITLDSVSKETISNGQTLPLNKPLSVASDLAIIENGKTEVVLRKQSRFLIESSALVTLQDGSLRARVTKALQGDKKTGAETTSKNPSTNFSIKGPSAVAGVRGTDFYIAANSSLSESEVVVFEGKVSFQNIKKSEDSQTVPAGHWGGLGGRFGSQISPILALPPEFLSGLQLQLTFN